MSESICGFDLVSGVNEEIFRLDALLKAIRVAAYDHVEQRNSALVVSVEDFSLLADIAIDRLKLIKEHVDTIECKIRKIGEAHHE